MIIVIMLFNISCFEFLMKLFPIMYFIYLFIQRNYFSIQKNNTKKTISKSHNN